MKALAAVLHADINCSFDIACPEFHWSNVKRCQDGYRVYKSKMEFNYWHFLAVAKTPGLMPVLSESAVWTELRSERFTTPLLRGWVPWLMQELEDKEQIVRLHCFGCDAGLLTADTEFLDKLVEDGITNCNISIE